jgi:hypothetical protein
MSELSSQAYDSGARPSPAAAKRAVSGSSTIGQALSRSNLAAAGDGRAPARDFCFPPWARAQVISPENGREVAEGETGLIRVFDLANVFSVMAIQTEDLGVKRDGGSFEVIGRVELAEARGCSLMVRGG